MPSMEFLLNM